MGLLFSPVKNRFVAEGEKIGEKRGEMRRHADWNAWLASNPEIQKMVDKGEVTPPPTLNGKNGRR